MQRNLLAASLMAVCGFAFAATATAQSEPPPPSASSSAMQGSSAEGHTADVNGVRIHYEMSGQGPALLLIHGYPLDGNLFAHQREALASHFKVITPDLPGFGQSGTLNGHATLEAYAKCMFGLMDKLGIKQAIIGGHSMGGMTTVAMYKMHPDRFSGMILIDTAAAAAPLPNKMLWEGYDKLAKTNGDYKKTMIMLLAPQMLTGNTRMHDPQLMSQYKAMIMAASQKGVEGGAMALADRPDNSSVLGTVKVPTLILVGSEDPLTPYEIAQKMHDAVQGSKLDIVKGGSHAQIFAKSKQADQDILQWAEASHVTSVAQGETL